MSTNFLQRYGGYVALFVAMLWPLYPGLLSFVALGIAWWVIKRGDGRQKSIAKAALILAAFESILTLSSCGCCLSLFGLTKVVQVTSYFIRAAGL